MKMYYTAKCTTEWKEGRSKEWMLTSREKDRKRDAAVQWVMQTEENEFEDV